MSKTSTRSAPNRAITTPDSDSFFWQWSRFSELTTADLYAVVQLREAVFIVEQNCPYPDADGRDPNAWHLLGWLQGPQERKLVAYARIFEPGVRGTGVGKALMAEALRRFESVAPGQPVKIAAQRRLEDFYLGFGFRTVSDPYEEDGITHVDMII